MSQLDNPNIIALHEVITFQNLHCLVLDFWAGGGLCDDICQREAGKLGEDQAKKLFGQIINDGRDFTLHQGGGHLVLGGRPLPSLHYYNPLPTLHIYNYMINICPLEDGYEGNCRDCSDFQLRLFVFVFL